MKRTFSYFRLQLKRFLKLLPAVLLLSALLVSALWMGLYGVYSAGDNGSDSLVNIAIVGDMEDTYLGMAVDALKNMDSSRFSISVSTIENEPEAAEKLAMGELVAYLVMPDDFVEEAIRGNVQKVKCVTSAGAVDFGTRVTNELMATVTEIVENSQKAVFGFQNAVLDSGADPSKVNELGTMVAFELIDYILDRESAYDIAEIGNEGKQRLDDPMVCGVMVLLIMLWGITCCTVFSSRSRSLSRVMYAKGTRAFSQISAEYLAYLVYMTAVLAVIAVPFVLFLSFGPQIKMLEAYDLTRLFPGVMFVILVISSMQFFLYEIASSVVSGALLQFLVAIGMGYISGCIYPSFFFPRAVQDISSVLPAYNCRIWLDELLAARVTAPTALIMLGYFAVFILLSVAVRRIKLSGKGAAA